VQASVQILPIRARSSGVMPGAGCLLDHLLVAALHGAVALTQMDRVAVGIGQHLDLDMARIGQVLLHVDRIVTEAGLGFLSCQVDRLDQVFRLRGPRACRDRRHQPRP
jgi:hypothetical protein